MARIFISYKRTDKDKVFSIKEKIEKTLGEECWIDMDGIESDAQFANVIIKAINDCSVFLFMYSHSHQTIKDYKKDWTIREISFALKKDKRIVFVNIDKSPLADWFELVFGTQQQVDATSDSAMKKLYGDINKWLGTPKPEHPQPVNDKRRRFIEAFLDRPTEQRLGEYCAYCKFKIADSYSDAKFCPNCGNERMAYTLSK